MSRDIGLSIVRFRYRLILNKYALFDKCKNLSYDTVSLKI